MVRTKKLSVGATELTAQKYNVLMSLCLIYGFVLNALTAFFLSDAIATMNPIVLCIGYLVLAIIGIFVTNAATNALMAFVGYNLVCVPSGALIAACLPSVNKTDISIALMGTTVITVAMLLISVAKPEFFKKTGPMCVTLLFITIIVELLMFLIFRHSSALIDWVVIAIMAIFIGYDYIRANEDYYCARNAICYSLDLYLDIINIFVRLLSRANSSSSKK